MGGYKLFVSLVWLSKNEENEEVWTGCSRWREVEKRWWKLLKIRTQTSFRVIWARHFAPLTKWFGRKMTSRDYSQKNSFFHQNKQILTGGTLVNIFFHEKCFLYFFRNFHKGPPCQNLANLAKKRVFCIGSLLVIFRPNHFVSGAKWRAQITLKFVWVRIFKNFHHLFSTSRHRLIGEIVVAFQAVAFLRNPSFCASFSSIQPPPPQRAIVKRMIKTW